MSVETPTKGDRTRVQIEDAAIELFMEQGYHATSMRQIAERAELALGGIYNHFASKDEIFQAIIMDKHPYKRILPAILEAEGETTEEFLRNAVRITISELGQEPFFIKLMMIEIIEFDGKHGSAMIRKIAPKVLPVFERLVKSRKNLRLTNPAMLMRVFMGMIISYHITELIVSKTLIKKLMPKNSMDIYMDTFLHGVLKPEA
jgi:AcrR family transcriptional regulator